MHQTRIIVPRSYQPHISFERAKISYGDIHKRKVIKAIQTDTSQYQYYQPYQIFQNSHKRLMCYFEINDLFNTTQYGYRHRELTWSHWMDILDGGAKVQILLCDLNETFDTVSDYR